MMIGQARAVAELCSPPASSYEPALARDTQALRGLYTSARLDPDDIPADIEQGRQEETMRHNDPSWPLRCDLFPQQVLAIETHIARIRNQ